MKRDTVFIQGIFFAAGLFCLFCLAVLNEALAYDFAYWDHGAYGYDYALQEAKEKEKPLVLYFHNDECEWCEDMDRDYLASYAMEVFLIDIPKVEINPDRGEAEEALTAQYEIPNFPAFLITIPAFDTKPQRIHPFSPDGHMTARVFLKHAKDWLISQYNQKAFSTYEGKDFEASIGYFETALKFDSRNLYARFGLAMAYHAMGQRDEDPKLLKEAEENYLEVLKMDRKHEESKTELERLREDMKKIREK
jgi:tetratricopeptide (TPR) repeat protein